MNAIHALSQLSYSPTTPSKAARRRKRRHRLNLDATPLVVKGFPASGAPIRSGLPRRRALCPRSGVLTYFPHVPRTISGGGGEGLGRQLYELKNLALQVVERRVEDLDQVLALAKAMAL